LLVVDETMYGVDPRDGGWVILGSPPSASTPAAVRLRPTTSRPDVGGATLRRITAGMTGLTTRELDDGSTLYTGTVAAGLIARETGFKEGRSIGRVQQARRDPWPRGAGPRSAAEERPVTAPPSRCFGVVIEGFSR
jgi:hypothetical protein